MTINETEDKTLNTDITEEPQNSEENSEKEEHTAPELDKAQMRAAALAYAKYLKDKGLAPGEQAAAEDGEETEEPGGEASDEGSAAEGSQGDDTDASDAGPEDDEAGEKADDAADDQADDAEDDQADDAADEQADDAADAEASEPETGDIKDGSEAGSEGSGGSETTDKGDKEDKEAKNRKKIIEREAARENDQKAFLEGGRRTPLAAFTELHDKAQDGIDRTFSSLGRDIVRGAHRIASSYQNSIRGIGITILVTGILAAAVLIVFDMFTVYEYAYNGKIMGYVNEQEEVIDVLDVAARNLSKNNGNAKLQFVANQNITFNLIDGRGKSTDDSDTVVNKLIYMTDIETEAYAVYDGNRVVAVVKDENDAEALLKQTQDELSTPDRGMKLVSSRFINDLSTRPVNVLLGSIQSNAAAKDLMINGGDMNTYHLVEADETLESLAEQFGVEVSDIYDENNSHIAMDIEQGDKVCIRSTVEPVSVEMVETGSIKEVVPFETIKKKSKDYYKGDSFLEQEGQDGIQVFTGTITKVGGVETERKQTRDPEILQEKIDKVILVGTAKRPKTAATGTFIMPIKTYVVTSEWGGRWGRMHEGIDFGAATGTPIYASDGGKVIKANFWSGHGLCVEIDHGNGVITRYSHCSAVHVSVGDLVYQGQHIANVGNTGHSFGSHLHFEVRVNGSSQNPRNYVNP